MNIAEMHVWFRQYAQQMGMQNVRAILPEQIDVLINTSISDIVNQLIRENIGVVNDRIITDSVKLNQINVLRTLYRVYIADMAPSTWSNVKFIFNPSDRKTGKMSTDGAPSQLPDYLFLVDFSLNYRLVSSNRGYGNNQHINFSVASPHDNTVFVIENMDSDNPVNIVAYNPTTSKFENLTFKYEGINNSTTPPTGQLVYEDEAQKGYILKVATKLPSEEEEPTICNYFIIVPKDTTGFEPERYLADDTDFTNPVVASRTTYNAPAFDSDEPETNYFPVRIIQDAYLADTLNDFVLKNRLRSPVMVTYNGVYDLYIDEFHKVIYNTENRYVLRNNLIPCKLRMSYVAKPAVVKYDADLSGTNVDCDLPESIHVDILKHAVDLYNTSINGGLYNAQQNQQANQREMIRNEARPTNEGYQN